MDLDFPFPPPLITLRTIDFRRAVFATLLADRRAVTLDELVTELEIEQHIDIVGHLRVSPRQRLADLLWWEIERGHVMHVPPGRYRIVESSLTESVRRRCECWRELFEQRDESRGFSRTVLLNRS